MNSYLVTVKYEPGTPKTYLVQNVSNHDAARARVASIIGYDPGVPVEVVETPINKNKPVLYSNLGQSND